jgi:BioD-like phosphotransacetylase family protein
MIDDVEKIKEILSMDPEDLEDMTPSEIKDHVQQTLMELSKSAGFKGVFINVMADQFRMDYEVEAALRSILESLSSQGVPVDIAQGVIKGYISKLSNLRLLSNLIDIFDLLEYKSGIMNLEIEKNFGLFKKLSVNTSPDNSTDGKNSPSK